MPSSKILYISKVLNKALKLRKQYNIDEKSEKKMDKRKTQVMDTKQFWWLKFKNIDTKIIKGWA